MLRLTGITNWVTKGMMAGLGLNLVEVSQSAKLMMLQLRVRMKS